ncbi:MAG: AAA family ATPase [Bacteroidia bacterium]|nr:AAA family ATPase [Bacteroidia bacterium]
MEKQESSLLKIKEEDLLEYKEDITAYLKQVSWKPDNKTSNSSVDLNFLTNVNRALEIQQEDEISIIKAAVRISDDRVLLSNTCNQILNALRRGYSLGKHVANLYSEASGLELLQQKNTNGDLHQSELPEFHDKSQTQSAILVYSASSYILYALSDFMADEVASIQMDFNGIPQISLTRPSKAIQCTMYYYAAYLERSGVVNTDLHFLKITLLYFERVIEEIQLRKNALKYSEIFTQNHYKLENSEFVLQGFETHSAARVKGMQFNPTRMEEIVSNKEAKHMFKRYAERLLCYDIDAKKNPMNELGGLPSITMADGKPGTGKSMLIAATATLLQERCDQLGLHFLFWPLPENIVSTFQGGTAERAMEWFKPMQDPNKIVFAPIDDAENNLEERTRQGVSAGVREFIGVFLRNTEGAYAVNHGNRLMSLFTNIPDQIDKAVLSRIQMRISMEGASTKYDFMDQDYLWWKKYSELDENFVNNTKPKDYTFMDAQKEANSINDLIADKYSFKNHKVEDIYNTTKQNIDLNSHEFFGAFYDSILDQYPFFSSRDLRNIQKAVDARLIDFDLPEIWWDNPNDFFTKNYDQKLTILKDLMKQNMKGASFGHVRIFEALNYIENAIRINETGINREIKMRAREMYIQQQANQQLNSGIIND